MALIKNSDQNLIPPQGVAFANSQHYYLLFKKSKFHGRCKKNNSISVLMKSSFFLSALKSGLIVGCLDAAAASLQAYAMRDISPDQVFIFVASGALGQRAFEGGSSIAWIGLTFHFLIAISWTFLFYLAYSKINFVRSDKMIMGMAYGVVIWLVMNLAVIPLSLIGPRPFNVISATIQIIIHLFVIGLPISYLANKYFSGRLLT